MIVTRETKVSEILERYGDIADVMETLGIKRVGPLRMVAARFITVERAAKIHKMPVDELIAAVNKAIAIREAEAAGGSSGS